MSLWLSMTIGEDWIILLKMGSPCFTGIKDDEAMDLACDNGTAKHSRNAMAILADFRPVFILETAWSAGESEGGSAPC